MRALSILAAGALALLVAGPAAASSPRHGQALYGDPKYGPDFTHFDYANPDAPKGGAVKLGELQTFDNLNPFIVKGRPAAGVGNNFMTLTTASLDEPFSQYGLVAETIEVSDQRDWVLYQIRPEATFSDGSKITPDDVLFSFETLKAHGLPLYRSYWADVVKAEKVGDRGVKFSFRNGENRELTMIMGQVPVLSKAYWQKRDFEATTLEPPVGNGPYRIAAIEPGRSISYERVKDWWGEKLPAMRGLNNFATIRYDYYRDRTVQLEAFKAGAFDYLEDRTSKNWATGYDGPALRQGLIVKEEIPNQVPQGMQGFFYNTRRPIFADPLVRKALAYAFDFEWENKNLFYNSYQRSHSYWNNTDLGSSGLPEGKELALLEPYRAQLPPALFTATYAPPKTDGSGNIRDNLVEAFKLLKQAGWSVKGKQLVNEKTGEPFQFELLIDEPSMERIVLPFIQNLERLGIKVALRSVDPNQYVNRMNDFDFDMTTVLLPESVSPGNEQRDYFSSAAADDKGSENYAGVRSPIVDALIGKIVAAETREDLLAATHALDRVLLNSYYVIPQMYLDRFWVASWKKFRRPAVSPLYSIGFNSWWIEPDAAAKTEAAKQGLKPE